MAEPARMQIADKWVFEIIAPGNKKAIKAYYKNEEVYSEPRGILMYIIGTSGTLKITSREDRPISQIFMNGVLVNIPDLGESLVYPLTAKETLVEVFGVPVFTGTTCDIHEVIIPYGELNCDYMFCDTAIGGKSVTIPASVTSCVGMFKGCNTMYSPPELPKYLDNASMMFEGCTSMRETPELPPGITNISSMFKDCKLMEYTPVMPLSTADCRNAFENCKSLTSLPEQNITLINGTMGFPYYHEACYRNCISISGKMTYTQIPAEWK